MDLTDMPFLRYDSEDGDGQDGSGSEESDENGQVDLKKLSKQFENLYKHVSKMTSEIGTVKQTGESISEMRETLNSFAEQFNAIQERLPRGNDDADQFDPYDKNQLVNTFNAILEEKFKPLQDNMNNFITQDSFASWLNMAQQNATLKNEFKLTDKELEELTKAAEESGGKTMRELAFEQYGSRFFKDDTSKTLSKELRKKDTQPPPEPDAESNFKKLGIPTDPEEFERMFREKGRDAMRQQLMQKKE